MLEKRSEELEIMDDLEISGPVVDQTLRELNTINQRLGGNTISITALKELVSSESYFSVADLGCGGGDIMKQMAKWCRKAGKNGRFIGIDANPNIIDYAKENTAKFPEISYQAANIFSDEFKSQAFDVIHCCLFLHHFTNKQLVLLFKHFKKKAKIGVIVNDLHRHSLAYWSIRLLTYLFSNSSMVRNDAGVSVARGFKKTELKEILAKAGITDYTLSWKWAFRWKLVF